VKNFTGKNRKIWGGAGCGKSTNFGKKPLTDSQKGDIFKGIVVF
jgi:hypothetical protein